jgi:hypothetical protein
MYEFEDSSDICQLDNIIYRRTGHAMTQAVSDFSHWMPRFTFSIITVGFVVEQGFL